MLLQAHGEEAYRLSEHLSCHDLLPVVQTIDTLLRKSCLSAKGRCCWFLLPSSPYVSTVCLPLTRLIPSFLAPLSSTISHFLLQAYQKHFYQDFFLQFWFDKIKYFFLISLAIFIFLDYLHFFSFCYLSWYLLWHSPVLCHSMLTFYTGLGNSRSQGSKSSSSDLRWLGYIVRTKE